MPKALPLLFAGGAALLLLGGKKKPAAGASSPEPSPAGAGETPASNEAAGVWADRQMALDFLGYEVGDIDGTPGTATREALKTFQADVGIPPTGEWDETTASAMKAAGLARMRDMSWDALRSLWARYFPGWAENPSDETIEFDKLFERLTGLLS